MKWFGFQCVEFVFVLSDVALLMYVSAMKFSAISQSFVEICGYARSGRNQQRIKCEQRARLTHHHPFI